MIPQVLEVLGKLAVPVRNIGGVEKVVVADVLDGLRQESFFGLETEINRGLTHHLAGFFLEVRRLELAAELPMFVHAVEPVREPAGTDFKKGQAEFGEAHRHALKNHAGEMQKDADRKGVAVHLGESPERARADLG